MFKIFEGEFWEICGDSAVLRHGHRGALQARASREHLQRRTKGAVTGPFVSELLADLSHMRWCTVVLLHWRQECAEPPGGNKGMEGGLHELGAFFGPPFLGVQRCGLPKSLHVP